MLGNKIDQTKKLLSEIPLKRIGLEIYEKIRKNEELTFLKSLNSIHLGPVSLNTDVLKDRFFSLR
ncbi:toxin-antitoxin system, toxin component, PIN family [Leptospira mayottensis 200901122]|uniref:Toxin-antitoxin system, toxin component, PIN family n=2 Tax=Leptospira mayottensis TaxID=1137606 RepID=A0AA87ML90_9LEPT|nr:toxin-antitoxin system, toxin component, PIN family protein [Leptospira mayottensis]EKR98402.1 toxin-antitoxin system, toxin component, PIN family [Leptospira mayottensis 200901122]